MYVVRAQKREDVPRRHPPAVGVATEGTWVTATRLMVCVAQELPLND